MHKATFGGGCFWCTEAVFERLKGVKSVTSGYAGGHSKNPTYQEVSTGSTGHAEVTQIEYDPEVISFEELLEVFFETHDPTTMNRQGNDVGTQYRSIILYHNEEQKEIAERFKQRLNQSDKYDRPIVTEIEPLDEFYEAERYHQDFYRKNPNQQYCRLIIRPKLKKVDEVFRLKLE
ncbi:peptide-methionine (S)-S-oxide reductase [Candidatus Thorarchaeota archaeon]|jgi:peptide-methionine (S)-S-oxide reductase|nr:MAG: peptide-methionine (S)-S-oxide reductase [Candidatus Thorarchaeota archaeon]